MEYKEEKISRELIAFSDQTIFESSQRTGEVIRANPLNFNIEKLPDSIQPELLETLSIILDKTVAEDIYTDTTDDELNAVNEALNHRIKNWGCDIKRVLDVTLLSKILTNREYTTKLVNNDLLRELLTNNHTEDLSYIWLSSLRQKLVSEKE
ncbi:MAG: hypothetical protein UR34_C0018G0008 [candidate division WS6 bacterium GW2011_GWC1_33_20]|uniref:Uncharacterized protein n=1 Tax=candidate division WS6 bacterium GW2011_GWC1_33_20 TaxID=1619089 RepID=A0A0F9ZGP9_9BACT|nr:MAG: hypothetical protein UR32_C0009G0021 [candidate division WS6 bacterium GW2011_GWE2_33_157]KKP43353.1 MAG: hypothetical protein UR34_C0018G0008 [candidate division WS6 bacterium GW2011_GWC1_33_20]KKP45606.1 MAG: hypothetical protein UR36_C0007G0021 [candidate division WS6 bacterium GW2011_GWF1_33_233]KKP53211.1 MAG: hypothetical protein UR45_C0031G0003 [candidate division WS6 bacterium GW2011_WS6_33_547]KKP82161.1 MAG: hypothetical protein UR84_C0007G0022 [candidate division WS6 bacteriu